ncbi:MAG: aminodeoxychorismate/anthranilate synthase component II [Planctomycetota bacterium]|nr:MAG: aminodeoxychorismate/anthranilate synthase component II [Planctomycetota bacterium]
MILLIDNYDSFVFNLARYFERLGHEVRVVRNDAITSGGVAELGPQAIVLSPGPCTPREAGCSVEVIQQWAGRLPILGICLGHQAIGAAFGGRVVRAAEPVHGRASSVVHDGRSVFAGLPNPLIAGRYHSLAIDPATLPRELEATAWTADGTIMAVAHCEFPVVGLQFHPESVLTDLGFDLLGAFLRQSGLAAPDVVPRIGSERVETVVSAAPLPDVPVTF